MGGNGAYIASEGGVPMRNRTHNDTEYRIDGHKVLVQAGNPKQKKTPMNSNSENPIYLCGKTDKEGKVTITTIGIYEKHKLVMTIDIEYDKNGNVILFAFPFRVFFNILCRWTFLRVSIQTGIYDIFYSFGNVFILYCWYLCTIQLSCTTIISKWDISS